MRLRSTVVSASLLVAVVAGCGAAGEGTLLPTWPVSEEVLADATTSVAAAFGRAMWELNPDFPPPGPTTTELHILVWEETCSSGRPATGRISPPAIVVGPTTVSIRIGVRGLDGLQTCPRPPGTPARLWLPEPLGTRTLIDATQAASRSTAASGAGSGR